MAEHTVAPFLHKAHGLLWRWQASVSSIIPTDTRRRAEACTVKGPMARCNPPKACR